MACGSRSNGDLRITSGITIKRHKNALSANDVEYQDATDTTATSLSSSAMEG